MKKELLKDLFKCVLEDLKTAERCKEKANTRNDTDTFTICNEQSRRLTDELESIVDELMKS